MPDAQLIITIDGRTRSFALSNDSAWEIGRATSAKISLPDDAASRIHALLQRNEMEEFYLIDAGSRNGTFLNGRRLATPALLKHGDQIAIGSHRLEFRHPGMPGSAGPETAEERFLRTHAVFSEHLVTVLVIDIQGFTTLTQQIDRELLCGFVSHWFSDASRVFRAHGCAALKFIGDAVMAVWLHQPAEEHPAAVRLILEGVIEFAGISCAKRYRLPVPLRFCAGLNSGFASVGNAGGTGHNDFTAFGEVVNAAFRIEACTRQIGVDIALGARTMNLLSAGASAIESLREYTVTLKGYSEPVLVGGGSFADVRDLCVRLSSGTGA